MMENIKPMDIEKRSFAIITELLGDTKLEEENELVIKRVIHTTADFDYVQNLVFSPHAVTKGLDALRAGCHIVTDTQMAKAAWSPVPPTSYPQQGNEERQSAYHTRWRLFQSLQAISALLSSACNSLIFSSAKRLTASTGSFMNRSTAIIDSLVLRT